MKPSTWDELDVPAALLDASIEAKGRRFDPVPPLDLRALMGQSAPPRQWLIDQWLPLSGVTLCAGGGGTGKSLLMQQVETALALGESFVGGVGLPARAMLWNCEDDADELWRRQEAISARFGVSLDGPAESLALVSRYGRDNVLMVPTQHRAGVLAPTNVFEELRQQVNDLGIEHLCLDNVAHVFGGDENNRAHVTAFIGALSSLVTGRPFATTLVAHTARAQGSEFAGSAAWENAVRMRWYFGSRLPDQKDDDGEPDPSVRFLARRKSNYSAQDHVRMTYEGGTFVPDATADRMGGLLSALQDRKAEEITVEGFRSLLGMGIRPTDGATSPDYLPRQIIAKGLHAGCSKSELARAMNRLMGRGVFARGAVGQYANRTPRLGLVLVSEGGK